MRLVSPLRAAALVAALVGFAPAVEAVPITYLISGTASGTIGGASFTDAFIEVALSSDTESVVSEPFGGLYPPGLANVGPTTVTIEGIGTATVLEPTGIWGFPVAIPDDEDLPPVPLVIIGTIDDPPLTNSFTGLAGVGSSALAGYDLASPFGPLTDLGGVFYPTQLFVNTSLGALRFSANELEESGGTFTAVTQVSEVPEPASLLLLGGGLAAVAVRLRCRQRS